MNLTDVDDKTIRGANEAKLSLRDFTTKYAELFFRDIDRARLRARRDVSARDRPRPRDAGRSRRRLLERGNAYESEGLDLLPDRDLPGVRPPLGHRSRPRRGAASASPTTSTRRRTSATSCSGRRPSRASRRGRRRGAGAARLAHRVLGDEHEVPRRALRHPHRRRGQHLPAPRERDRPERGRDRAALRRRLAARRAPDRRRREDGEVEGQLLHARRRARARATIRSRSATCSCRSRTARSSTSPGTR